MVSVFTVMITSYTATYTPVPLGYESTAAQSQSLNEDEDGECFYCYDNYTATYTPA